MDDPARHLDRWMSLLHKNIRDYVPVIYLAIPGSHNSMSYGINARSCVSSDGSFIVQVVNHLAPEYSARWLKDQEYNAYEQLENGIRYFDLRVCKINNTNCSEKFYFCHAFVSVPIYEPFEIIEIFLRDHTKELIILDFQHFYDMDIFDHYALQKFIIDKFDCLIISPTETNLCDLTLQDAHNLKKQIIVVYRNDHRCESFWPGECWPTPRATRISQLENFLDSSLYQRENGTGYISQCVITPTFEFVAENFGKSMVNVADNVYCRLERWISHQSQGFFENKTNKPKMNVVIADFVNLNKNIFCKHIIKLNQRLLKKFKNFETCKIRE